MHSIHADTTAVTVTTSNTNKGEFKNTPSASMLFDVTVHQWPGKQLYQPVVRDFEERCRQAVACGAQKIEKQTNQNA
jgi:hypothetical protein